MNEHNRQGRKTDLTTDFLPKIIYIQYKKHLYKISSLFKSHFHFQLQEYLQSYGNVKPCKLVQKLKSGLDKV